MSREHFLSEFGSRTAAYLDGVDLHTRPVAIVIGEGAHSVAGHTLLAALVNQLARAHRRLVLIGDLDRAMLARDPFGARDLRAATRGLARTINPFIEIEQLAEVPADALLRLAVGVKPAAGELGVGCSGWCATFGPQAEVIDTPAAVWGAALASCIAAASAFQLMCGREFRPLDSYSLWGGGGPGAEQGPAVTSLGLGRVLQVGAGAVGAALDYWLFAVGANFAEWWIVDGDLVDISNLNRQLLYRALDAGYPAGAATSKALASAQLIGAHGRHKFWDAAGEAAIVEADYDTVLALANERGVRSALQMRQPPILMHATTSANWQAQSHRHIRGRDDCILCRLPGDQAQLQCSTAKPAPDSEVDAALPFLSAAAGLLLAADLVRLSEGALGASTANFKALDFGGSEPVGQALHYACGDGCRTWLPATVRRKFAADTLFAGLDV
jgi:ThiF family protein